MITMTEIARLTHVSQPTVSRVLNGNPNVAPEIRARVLACAQEHDYQFNALAKGLQGSKTKLLGVLLTDISNGFFADLAKQIELEARKNGYSIILFNSGRDPGSEQEYMDVVRRYRVDGVLAVPIQPDSLTFQDMVRRLDFPVVAVTRRVESLDSVYLDHREAGGLVAGLLVQRGYQRFLFIGREADQKYLGFRENLSSRGFGEYTASLEYQDDEQLREGLRAFLRQSSLKPSIFASNDIYGMRVLSALRELGVPVPGQAGVIGFDDTALCQYLTPSLSSVAQPIDVMARQAVSRLMERIDHPGPLPVLDQPLHARLVLRESS